MVVAPVVPVEDEGHGRPAVRATQRSLLAQGPQGRLRPPRPHQVGGDHEQHLVGPLHGSAPEPGIGVRGPVADVQHHVAEALAQLSQEAHGEVAPHAPHISGLRHAGQDGPLRAPPVEGLQLLGEGLLPLPGGLGVGVGQHVEALQRIGVQVRGDARRPAGVDTDGGRDGPQAARQVDGDGGAPRAPRPPTTAMVVRARAPGWFPAGPPAGRCVGAARRCSSRPGPPGGAVRDVRAAPGAARHRSPASLQGPASGRGQAGGQGGGGLVHGQQERLQDLVRRGVEVHQVHGARGACPGPPSHGPPLARTSGDSGTAGVVAGGVVAVRVGREEDERDTAPAQLREPVARQAVQVEGEQGVDLPAARGLQHLVRAQAAPGDGEGDRQRALGVGEAGEEEPLALRIAQPGGQADEPGQRIDAPGRLRPGRGPGGAPPRDSGDGSCRETGDARPGGVGGGNGARSRPAAPPPGARARRPGCRSSGRWPVGSPRPGTPPG